MSDVIKHECGIALIRLRKPLEYFQMKYGTWAYGINKLYLLMEKQHNRGQDGAGVVALKLNLKPGEKYLERSRSNDAAPINKVFEKINSSLEKIEKKNPDLLKDAVWAKNNLPYAGEILLGHLRYGTYGKNKMKNVHPVMRQNNWKSRNLVLAGNFTLTNVNELFKKLIDLGQHPKDSIDTIIMLENIGHFLDEENQRLFDKFKEEGYNNVDISHMIARDLDVQRVLSNSSKRWDGGYVIAGMIGHGDAFVTRDPWGIRPAYYYYDDEIAVVTSERPVIQTAFNVSFDKIHPVPPGNAFIVKQNGDISIKEVREPQEKKACSFERIYFSRGNDKVIYNERKMLGQLLTNPILEAVEYDLENTVFSYIPNTSEAAFYGMIHGVEDYMTEEKKKQILALGDNLNGEEICRIISPKPRVEKIAHKDIKLRTFIAQEEGRGDLVGHVYDITYGSVVEGKDNLVVIDDSIVRGTTLRMSILRILDRLNPRRIIIVSSSPQIRFPDCYGIDMAKLSDFVAFRAAIALLKERGKEKIINEVYLKAKSQYELPREDIPNYVKRIYEPFTPEEISDKIAEMLSNKQIKSEVKIVYQTVDNLHKACPDNLGDWYFTGDYPTPGGNVVSNMAFVNYIEGKNRRAY